MNERIQKLAEHAGFILWKDEVWNPGNVIDWASDYDQELQRFAELVVRECIEQGKLIQSQTVVGGSEEYIAGREMGIEVFINQVREHFGVE